MAKEGKRHLRVREVDATPHAAPLIEGHRDFGYSLETALADIIDNSITACADKIHMVVETAGISPFIAVVDNGKGMTEVELIEAMRLGSKNPKHVRDKEDLGRFGLGLKSASFSQCRKLTVITRKDGKISCARWDVDRVSDLNKWSLELIDDPSELVGFEYLEATGTVVVWQKLDRIIEGFGANNDKRTVYFNSEIHRAEQHLRLVFHRFLQGRKPRVVLLLNNRKLTPIDPLASSYSATQKDPEEILKLEGGTVRIQCHTLPHHKKISTEDWEKLGGTEGHLKSQGFYIYRENRLIISGGWLGLARQTELTKLCRISVDIPNTMDAEWKIDVKKASAQLPPLVRERLKKVVERLVGTSKRTYRTRGQRLVDESKHPLWIRVKQDGQVVFRPNIDHPVFKNFFEKLPADLKDGFTQCLRILGSGLPIETLHAELIGGAESVVADEVDEKDLSQMVHAMADVLSKNGIVGSALASSLQSHPYLKSNWSAVENIVEEYSKGAQK